MLAVVLSIRSYAGELSVKLRLAPCPGIQLPLVPISYCRDLGPSDRSGGVTVQALHHPCARIDLFQFGSSARTEWARLEHLCALPFCIPIPNRHDTSTFRLYLDASIPRARSAWDRSIGRVSYPWLHLRPGSRLDRGRIFDTPKPCHDEPAQGLRLSGQSR